MYVCVCVLLILYLNCIYLYHVNYILDSQFTSEQSAFALIQQNNAPCIYM